MVTESAGWVALLYRVPRQPSAPRLAIWRRLRRLGVLQLADGLVALPADARTRELFEWTADAVVEAGGEATLLHVKPTAADERGWASTMAAARAQEYEEIRMTATQALSEQVGGQRRTLKRLRAELRRVRRRDYFPPSERDRAVAALKDLAERIETPIALEVRS